MTTVNISTTDQQLRTKLANLVDNAVDRLNDDTHPQHVLELVLDRLAELATTPINTPSAVDGQYCCGELMAENANSPDIWAFPGDPIVHVTRVYRCQVCDRFTHIEVTEPAQKTYLLAPHAEVTP